MNWMELAMHQAQQQIQDVKLVVMGHVSSYDPEKHAVKVMIPHMRDEDDNPLETNFIQLGTLMVGDHWGIQYAPKGGATPDEPTQGEQCLVMILNRKDGLFACAHLLFNDDMKPPGDGNEDNIGNDKGGDNDDPQGHNRMEGGEFQCHHESGSFLKFYQNGDVQVYTKANLNIYPEQDCNIDVRQGDLNVTVEEGDLMVNVQQGDLDVTLEAGDLNATLWKGDLTVQVDAGDVDIETLVGNITANTEAGSILGMTTSGDILLSSISGTINIQAALEVDIICDSIINLIAPAINAGVNIATVQQLCNTAFLTLFNTHTHTDPQGGSTGPPVIPAVPGVQSTVNFWAS